MDDPRPAMQAGGGPFPENMFRQWYREWAARSGLDPDPDAPEHKYNYRAAYSSGVSPEIDKADGLYHWPSRFKEEDHPNRYIRLPGGGVLDSLLDEVIRESK